MVFVLGTTVGGAGLKAGYALFVGSLKLILGLTSQKCVSPRIIALIQPTNTQRHAGCFTLVHHVFRGHPS